jgi:small subunit ribosomal protein S2
LAAELAKELVDSGIHFGHRASRWNPKMAPYIFGKRNLIHIINVKETLKGLLLAKRFLAKTVAGAARPYRTARSVSVCITSRPVGWAGR